MQTPLLQSLFSSPPLFTCSIFLFAFLSSLHLSLQMQAHPLKALAVFRNFICLESIRSVQVYPLENGKEKVVAREYVFHSHGDYEEIGSSIFILEKFRVSSLFKGFVSGVWLCIYVFDVDCPRPPNLDEVPEILLVSRDSKLLSIPTLANDLIMISQLTNKVEDGEKWQIVVKETGSLDTVGELSSTSQQTFALDLNSFPPELDNEEWDGQSGAGKKKRRAGPRVMAGMDLADLAKYFDLPIAEAAKNLKVGVTVLKKRCRELGIPRWPHRKIKSLDSLIQDLQNEVAQQQETDEATAMMVAQRQMMLQNEKHNIERKPFMEIQVETKRFRQDIFKKRHRAKARELLQY